MLAMTYNSATLITLLTVQTSRYCKSLISGLDCRAVLAKYEVVKVQVGACTWPCLMGLHNCPLFNCSIW